MKRATMVLLAMTIALLLAASSVFAGKGAIDDPAVEEEVRQGFEEILDLWREEKYADLYARTFDGGRETRESFAARLAAAPLKPSCCWEKLQEVNITVKSGTAATLRGRIGFDGPGNTEYKTKSVKMRKEDGVWRVSRSEIFTLAEAGKKKHKRRTSHYRR